MIRFVIGIIFGAVAIIFVVQNTEVADVQFLAWSFSMTRAMLYLILLFIGFALGWLVTSIRAIRRGRKKK